MGAVFFSLDRRLVDFLQQALPLPVFVETGTFRGDTIAEVADRFDEVHTVELSEELFREDATGSRIDRPSTFITAIRPHFCPRFGNRSRARRALLAGCPLVRRPGDRGSDFPVSAAR